jgi:hypothetical protein
MKNKIILCLYLLSAATITSNGQAKPWNNLNTNNGSFLLVLSCFTATSYKYYNAISWSTEMEIGIDNFTLEKSADGINFEKYTTMKSAGDSTKSLNYVTFDTEPINGFSYYRLRKTDLNSMIKYSNIITLDRKEDAENNGCSDPSEKKITFRLYCGRN